MISVSASLCSRKAYSLMLLSFEFPVAVTAMHDKGSVTLLLNEAGVDELRHEPSCYLPGLVISLQLCNLLLELLHHVVLGKRILLLRCLRFLVGLDLPLSPSALALRLEHVGSLALGNYMQKRKDEAREDCCTYC